jgi:hypothetical protein
MDYSVCKYFAYIRFLGEFCQQSVFTGKRYFCHFKFHEDLGNILNASPHVYRWIGDCYILSLLGELVTMNTIYSFQFSGQCPTLSLLSITSFLLFMFSCFVCFILVPWTACYKCQVDERCPFMSLSTERCAHWL